MPAGLQSFDKWSKVAGPNSGNFKNLRDLDNEYQNPKKGGVYKLQFELLGSQTESLIHLPLAGGQCNDWIVTQKTQMANMVDKIAQLPWYLYHFAIYHVSHGCDWYHNATPAGCGILGGDNARETITLYNVVVDRPKLQNLMWGYFIYHYVEQWPYLSWEGAKMFAGMVATPDSAATISAYEVGKDWHEYSLSSMFNSGRGYLMQEPEGVAIELWPNENTATIFPISPHYFYKNMHELELWLISLL